MIIIGDVHGGGAVRFLQDKKPVGMLNAECKLDVYFNIVRGLKQKTIQLGDLGFKREHEWFLKNVDYNQHKVLFGNHDYMPLVNGPHSLGDYALLDGGIMAIRGAYSIDRNIRTVGLDWFHDEELSMEKCEEVLSVFERERPRIVLSHDCPDKVCQEMHSEPKKSRTNQLLQACFERHQPELWVYGHSHRHWEHRMNGTKFVCLGELELLEI
jgi:predicted phosphodiesterase